DATGLVARIGGSQRVAVLREFARNELWRPVEHRRRRLGLALEPALGVELRALRGWRVAIDRRAGADKPEVVEKRIAECTHEEVVGKRIFPGPLPHRQLGT